MGSRRAARRRVQRRSGRGRRNGTPEGLAPRRRQHGQQSRGAGPAISPLAPLGPAGETDRGPAQRRGPGVCCLRCPRRGPSWRRPRDRQRGRGVPGWQTWRATAASTAGGHGGRRGTRSHALHTWIQTRARESRRAISPWPRGPTAHGRLGSAWGQFPRSGPHETERPFVEGGAAWPCGPLGPLARARGPPPRSAGRGLAPSRRRPVSASVRPAQLGHGRRSPGFGFWTWAARSDADSVRGGGGRRRGGGGDEGKGRGGSGSGSSFSRVHGTER